MDGVGQLATGTSQLSAGLEAYVEGGMVLAESSKDLYDGAAELNLGLSALREGMATYQEGTGTFKESTGNMDEDMNDQIDEALGDFLGDGSKTVSFVSDKNLSTASVQFFFRTEPIEIAKLVEPASVEEEETGFWYKILHLFDWVGDIFE
jgi:X-X-X-Leu-X-X-Gly heptad repeat protein